MAIAPEFVAGNFRFKNVAFMVFLDDQEPFSDMPEGERGIVGLPTLLAFRNSSWGSDETFEFGSRNRKSVAAPNLSFKEQYVVEQVEFGNSNLTFGLDTGREKPSLDLRFAETFTEIVSRLGKKDSTKVATMGSSKQVNSITLPELTLRSGGFPTARRPAPIL